jgi:hypothetical protein
MSALPPVGWADVATKSDLSMIRNEMDTHRAELRGEIADLRGRMEGGFAQMDGRFSEMEGRMTAGFAQVDGRFDEMDGRFDGLSGQLVGEIAKAKDSMGVWTIATMITLVLGMAGVAISILQLQH